MKLQTLFVILSVMGLWLGGSVRHLLAQDSTAAPVEQQTAADPNANPENSIEIDRSRLEALNSLAQQITVKVFAGETWGSGILIGREGETYTVLTNEHVLHGQDEYQIQSPTGQVYAGFRYQGTDFGSDDLALVQFIGSEDASAGGYVQAALGKAQTLDVGDVVFAAGFPVAASGESEGTEAAQGDEIPDGFKFTNGQVTLVSNKILEGGYQLGYTNAVEKGMSGGPVLNLNGEVVAINGMHAYPIWGNPYVFTDGSHPCESLRRLMVESSWAIPVERFMPLLPEALITADTASIQVLPPLTSQQSEGWLSTLTTALQTSQLQRRAEASQQCT